MPSTNTLTILLIIAVVIYMIVRQFTEQQVTPRSLLILPALITYYTGIRVLAELQKPLADPAVLLIAMVAGLALGGVIGWLRGGQVKMRRDAATGIVYAKPGMVSILIWFAILLVRIGAETIDSMGHLSGPLVLFIALCSTLFLGNILLCQLKIYLRSRQYDAQPTAFPPSWQRF